MIEMQQHNHNQWDRIDSDEFFKHIGVLQPIMVGTQQEYDYLWSMQLMIGREFTILLDGRDENRSGLPPSIVRIML